MKAVFSLARLTCEAQQKLSYYVFHYCYRLVYHMLIFLILLIYIIVVVIVFILCSVFFIVCVVLCTAFRLIVVLFCVMCVSCHLCLIVLPMPPGKNPLAVKINKLINFTLTYCRYKSNCLKVNHTIDMLFILYILRQYFCLFFFPLSS
jgi:hypothetical protein